MPGSANLATLGLLLVLITAGCLSSSVEPGSQANQTDNATSTKMIYYYFYSDACPACKLMEQTTLSNRTVLDALEANFILRKTNAATNARLAQRYGIVFVPTSVFTRPDGEELRRVVGAVPAEEFLKLLDEVVALAQG